MRHERTAAGHEASDQEAAPRIGGMPDQRLPRTALTGWSTEVAPGLLGATLVSTVGGALVAVRLTEVEAYMGEHDPGSHAFRGRTPRTAVMFGPAGYLYVYFTYGMHWCANIVCGRMGSASAVLVRAGEVVAGPGRRPRAAPCGAVATPTWLAARPGSRPRSASTGHSTGPTSASPRACSGSRRPGPARSTSGPGPGSGSSGAGGTARPSPGGSGWTATPRSPPIGPGQPRRRRGRRG